MEYEELEKLRKEIIKNYILGMVITIVIALLPALISVNFLIFFVFILMIGWKCIDLLTKKKKAEYTKEYKNYVVLNLLKEYFTDLKYEPSSGLAYEIIASTKIMNIGNTYFSNDYIAGRYKNVYFEQADVNIGESELYGTSDIGIRYNTIFNGRWMVFDIKKTFQSNIYILPKKIPRLPIQRYFNRKKQLYKKVQMESKEFNKKFNVYAQNENDATYILSPSLMDNIRKLYDKNEGEMLLCFINDKLHIGLHNGKDSFEHGNIFKPINKQKIKLNIINDIQIITQFIDELHSDNDLFR